MPLPSALPEWASNPTDPGAIVEPPGSLKEEGWVAATRPPAEYWNWYQNLVYQWVEYLRDERDVLRTDLDALEVDLEAQINALEVDLEAQIETLDDYLRPGLAAAAGAYHHAFTAERSGDWVVDPADHASLHRDGTDPGGLVWAFMAGSNMPFGLTLNTVRVFVKPAAARAGTSRMLLRVFRIPASAPSTLIQVGSDVYDAGTTAFQTLSLGSINRSFENTDSGVYGGTDLGIVVQVFPGTGSPNEDKVYFAETRFVPSIR